MYPTDLTVGAVILHEDRYLLVEEQAMGRRVISQPGGHIEAGESPEQAVVREVLEETACDVVCDDMIGVYLWIHPQTRQQFLRLMFAASFVRCDDDAPLDEGIYRRLWMNSDDIAARRDRLRTPVVLRSVLDFEKGLRQSDKLFSGMMPLQHNVDAVLARADLV